MRITADTNILVSSTFWKEDSFEIIERVEGGELELILSNEIIEEYSSVLNYKEIKDKIIDKNLEVRKTIQEIIKMSTIVEPKRKIDILKDDIDDN